MTLILTLATPRYVLQVSDRLVTRGDEPFDPASNKTVIYHAKNAMVSIGYSGLAYLDDVPTDQWIAQKLRGEGRFHESEPGRPAAFMYGRAPQLLDIGRSIELLRHDCAEVFSRLSPRMRDRQHLAIAGWQWRCRGQRAVARPILCEIRNSEEAAGRHIFEAEYAPRYWHWQGWNRFFLSWIPDSNPLRGRGIDDLCERLKRTSPSPDASQQLLVDAIRLAARKSSRVGPDCMCVFMPLPSVGKVEVSYISPRQARAVATGGQNPIGFPVTFKPWIVGPYAVSSPSILANPFSQRLGPVTVFVRGPEEPRSTGPLAVMSSQTRPPDPLTPSVP